MLKYISMLMCCWIASANTISVHAEETKSLDEIRWLLGDWVQEGERSTTSESWKEIHPEAFQGSGVTMKKGSDRPPSKEALLITVMSGEVFYFAKVAANKFPVPFQLSSSSRRHATFVNMEHDFPKRLEYRLESPETLHVRVSDGGDKGFTIRFVRQTREVEPAKPNP